MWVVEPLPQGGLGFAVHYADAIVARWLVDPALPWVLVAQHIPAEHAWHSLLLPLSIPGKAAAPRRVCNFQMDLLFRTDEFIAAAAEFVAAGQGGLSLWQLDREPRPDHAHALWQNRPLQRWPEMYRGLGVHLSYELPHRGETSVACGPDPATVRAAWMRVNSAAEIQQ